MKSAWYDENILPKQMVKGADGTLGWPRLEDSGHFKYLKEAISICEGNTLMDLGCGAGEVGRVYSEFDYIGYDLPHIIEKVAKKVNPHLKYDSFDAYETDFQFIKGVDIVLSNSFITELTNCTGILLKIIEKVDKYIVIHRQKFSENEEMKQYKTYGGLGTTECKISEKDFNESIQGSFDVIYSASYDGMKTMTLKKTN